MKYSFDENCISSVCIACQFIIKLSIHILDYKLATIPINENQNNLLFNFISQLHIRIQFKSIKSFYSWLKLQSFQQLLNNYSSICTEKE